MKQPKRRDNVRCQFGGCETWGCRPSTVKITKFPGVYCTRHLSAILAEYKSSVLTIQEAEADLIWAAKKWRTAQITKWVAKYRTVLEKAIDKLIELETSGRPQ